MLKVESWNAMKSWTENVRRQQQHGNENVINTWRVNKSISFFNDWHRSILLALNCICLKSHFAVALLAYTVLCEEWGLFFSNTYNRIDPPMVNTFQRIYPQHWWHHRCDRLRMPIMGFQAQLIQSVLPNRRVSIRAVPLEEISMI